jgi:hypothetical protein
MPTNLPATVYRPIGGLGEAVTVAQNFIIDTANNFLVDTTGNFVVGTTTDIQPLAATLYTANDGI